MDQMELIDAGTVFQSGPVVDLIVDNLPIEDKVTLLQQIEEEDEKRPPGTTSSMAGWKKALKVTLNNQRVISNYWMDGIEGSRLSKYSHFNHQDLTTDKDVIPDQWLEDEEGFEKLLLLCPNLTGIHLRERRIGRFNANNLVEIISNCGPNLTSFTLRVLENDLTLAERIIQMLRKRKGKMEFIDINNDKPSLMKELIETNPKLTAMYTYGMKMNFVEKRLKVKGEVLWEWTSTETISELCSYFRRFNSCYQKSSSDGIKLNGIKGFGLYSVNIDELIGSFKELEFLKLRHSESYDIGQLKVMTNLRALDLRENFDETQCVDELLSHLDKLEELILHRFEITETALQQLHTLCPNLRKFILLCARDGDELGVETLRGICKLARLEYFDWWTPKRSYCWESREVVEKKRKEFNVQLQGNDLI